MESERGEPPTPTEDLRSDLVAILRWMNSTERSTLLDVLARVHAITERESVGFRQLREIARSTIPSPVVSRIALAVERGEVDPARVTPRTESLAIDLMQLEMLTSHGPVPDRAIEEIVEEIVVPLLTGSSSTSTRRD